MVANGNVNTKYNKNSAGVLNVTTTPHEGFLLTEVFLSSKSFIMLMESVGSAQVVIEEEVLSTNNMNDDLILDARGSSTVFVSDTGSAATVATLMIETPDSASIQLNVASISSESVQLTSTGSPSIALLAPLLEATGGMILETQSSGTICTSAKQVTVPGDFLNESPSRVSFPNAANTHGTTGTLACTEAKVPAREPTSVTATDAASTAKVKAAKSDSIPVKELACTEAKVPAREPTSVTATDAASTAMVKAAKSDSIPVKEIGKQSTFMFGNGDDETIW
ncbi:hypothetical protein PHMEG_00018209 [Phytophthora megakarya]|uniref:Uncharacterized protein n=1 Tax=Phytophthora megakarya TaxID=4795 RepID=A0A225VUM7_9STRA|nr:hypothetical protein PHMEG_00018209 [Phytophthora megakarya]